MRSPRPTPKYNADRAREDAAFAANQKVAAPEAAKQRGLTAGRAAVWADLNQLELCARAGSRQAILIVPGAPESEELPTHWLNGWFEGRNAALELLGFEVRRDEEDTIGPSRVLRGWRAYW